MSWLQENSYYTWLGTSSNPNGQIIFTRTGANDPSFNLRSEQSFILRTHGEDTLLASVVETHGYFNEEFEQSVNARGVAKEIRVIGHSDSASVVEIETEKTRFTLMVSNDPNVTRDSVNHAEIAGKTYSWVGFYAIEQAVLV